MSVVVVVVTFTVGVGLLLWGQAVMLRREPSLRMYGELDRSVCGRDRTVHEIRRIDAEYRA